MKAAQFPTFENASPSPLRFGRALQLQRGFVAFIDALQRSRRIESVRLIRRYRHLLDHRTVDRADTRLTAPSEASADAD
jgi:hypothetical protein